MILRSHVVIPERLGDESFMVTRYRNLLLLYVDFMTLSTVASFFFRTESVLKRRRHQTAGGAHAPVPHAWRRHWALSFPQCSAKNDSQLQKLEGTEYTWSPLSPKLEGTRPTGPVGWLRLCLHPQQYIYIYMERVQTPIQKLHHR